MSQARLRAVVTAPGAAGWATAAHELSRLLAQGGDDRLRLQGSPARNAYGCTPRPDPALLALGSCTASVVSPAGFAAAGWLHDRAGHDEAAWRREARRLRHALAAALGQVDDDGLVLAASGTDVHLIAQTLAGGADGRPLPVVMAEPAETGSGVPQAVQGRHFNPHTALGRSAQPGQPLAGAAAHPLHTLVLRQADGQPCAPSDVDAQAQALVAQAMASDDRCLLVLTDLSKTGLLAPSPACVAALRQRHGHRLTVLVDACQLRLAAASLRDYLAQGWWVAVTGSKFIGGPTFCGALLLPTDAAAALADRPLRALAGHSTRADWPAHWTAARALSDVPNRGLLLRWQAALADLQAFARVAETEVATLLRRVGQAVADRLSADPVFQPLATPAPARGAIGSTRSWDRLPSIFSFGLRPTGPDGPALDMAGCRAVHQALQQPLTRRLGGPAGTVGAIDRRRYQLGQPVACGQGQQGLAVLRLCLGARQVIDAADGGPATPERLIDSALGALDKAALLARTALLPR